MRGLALVGMVVLLPISVLIVQLAEVILRFPSNHSASPYALVPIWLGALAVGLLASLIFRRILWSGVVICLVGMSLVWVFDVFNIWVDYSVYCQRGLPSWGSWGTRGISQVDMTLNLNNLKLPSVLWLVLMTGWTVLGHVSKDRVEWLKKRLSVYLTAWF